jgi:hypothetical protein
MSATITHAWMTRRFTLWKQAGLLEFISKGQSDLGEKLAEVAPIVLEWCEFDPLDDSMVLEIASADC